MIKTEEIRQLIENLLKGSDKFLVDILVKPGNKIFIFIDGDKGVTIDNCKEVSRFVENQLNRDNEDFELNVSSPGVDHPLKLRKQYPKNIGRIIDVTLKNGSILSGKLVQVSEEKITIDTTAKVKKKKKKNQKEPETDPIQNIPFDNIYETKVRISFK